MDPAAPGTPSRRCSPDDAQSGQQKVYKPTPIRLVHPRRPLSPALPIAPVGAEPGDQAAIFACRGGGYLVVRPRSPPASSHRFSPFYRRSWYARQAVPGALPPAPAHVGSAHSAGGGAALAAGAEQPLVLPWASVTEATLAQPWASAAGADPAGGPPSPAASALAPPLPALAAERPSRAAPAVPASAVEGGCCAPAAPAVSASANEGELDALLAAIHQELLLRQQGVGPHCL